MPTKDGKHAYTDKERAEIIAHVLVNVACGRFVSRIFKEDDVITNGVELPDVRQFWRWVLEDDNLPDGAPDKLELSHKLVRAREQGIEALLDETVDIADHTANDTIFVETDGGGYEKPNTEWITRSRLRIETRIKLAQMLKPKKYGAKLDLTSDGKSLNLHEQLHAARARVRELREQEGED